MGSTKVILLTITMMTGRLYGKQQVVDVVEGCDNDDDDDDGREGGRLYRKQQVVGICDPRSSFLSSSSLLRLAHCSILPLPLTNTTVSYLLLYISFPTGGPFLTISPTFSRFKGITVGFPSSPAPPSLHSFLLTPLKLYIVKIPKPFQKLKRKTKTNSENLFATHVINTTNASLQ